MRELFQNTIYGPGGYFQSNPMLVLALGVFLYLLTAQVRLLPGEKRLARLAAVLLVLILFPVSAVALMLYQSRFFSYFWIWSLMPLTLFVAWGSVVVLWRLIGQGRRDGRAGWRLLAGSAVLLALLLLTGNMGRLQTVSVQEQALDSQAAQVTAYLQELPEAEDSLLWAPRSVLEGVRRRSGGIRVIYGRSMWEPEAAAYAYDTYPLEQQRLYDWMEQLERGEAYETPDGEDGADAELLRLAAECGARIWVFPAEATERIELACEQLLQEYGLEARLSGEVAGCAVWICRGEA